jgi:phosphosulfolactate phosphohydrolase-like enzyme
VVVGRSDVGGAVGSGAVVVDVGIAGSTVVVVVDTVANVVGTVGSVASVASVASEVVGDAVVGTGVASSSPLHPARNRNAPATSAARAVDHVTGDKLVDGIKSRNGENYPLIAS